MKSFHSSRLSLLLLATCSSAIPLATAQTPPAAPAVRAFTPAPDPAMMGAINSGDFSSWRKILAARINLAMKNGGLTGERLQAVDLDIARHEFLLQTTPNADLHPATRPDQPTKPSTEDALKIIASNPEGKLFLRWLLNDYQALTNYLDCTYFSFAEPNRAYGLQQWQKICVKYPDSRSGLWCRVAAAIAVAYGKERIATETAWDQKIDRVIDPVERYVFFADAFKRGKLVSYFSEAPAWELVFTVHVTYSSMDDLEWMQHALPPDRFDQRGVAQMAYQIVRYRLDNYRSSSIHGSAYFDGKPNPLVQIADYGSVCGGISYCGTSFATAFGVPSFTIGQPGHCAYVAKGGPTAWEGENFVSGWKDSHDSHQLGFFGNQYSYNVRLLTRAYNHPQFRASERLRRIANLNLSAGDEPGAIVQLERAASICPVNFLARAAMVQVLTRINTPEGIARLSKECIDLSNDLAEFPMVTDLLRIEAENKRLNIVSSPSDKASYLNQVAAALDSSPASKQANLGTQAFCNLFVRHLTSFGFKEKDVERVIFVGLYPEEAKKENNAPPLPKLNTEARRATWAEYLNGIAPAANLRGEFATVVKSVIAAIPEDIRTSVTVAINPKPDPKPAAYDEKTFVKVGSWTRAGVVSAPVITVGWHELEADLPVGPRNPGRLTVAFVQKEGDEVKFENLRLFADGTEVQADDRSVPLKGNNKSGLFILDLDPKLANSKLKLKVIVSEIPSGKNSEGEIRILDPVKSSEQG